jgi:hypothetical protein
MRTKNLRRETRVCFEQRFHLTKHIFVGSTAESLPQFVLSRIEYLGINERIESIRHDDPLGLRNSSGFGT